MVVSSVPWSAFLLTSACPCEADMAARGKHDQVFPLPVQCVCFGILAQTDSKGVSGSALVPTKSRSTFIKLQSAVAAAVSLTLLATGCRVRWTVHGIPRVPWEAEGVFDGISEYKLDSEGKIYEHKVTNVQMRDPPFARNPLTIGLNLVQVPRLQGAPQVTTTVCFMTPTLLWYTLCKDYCPC